MAQAKNKSRKTTKKKAAKNQRKDAIQLLTEDHDEVKRIFTAFARLLDEGEGSIHEREPMVAEACHLLTIHTQIEEAVLYPALRSIFEEQKLIDEAEVEHACAKDLIAQLEDMSPNDDLYNAKFIVLGEQVKHHIREEEEEIFPRLRASGIDLYKLGDELLRHKQDLESILPEDNPLRVLFAPVKIERPLNLPPQ